MHSPLIVAGDFQLTSNGQLVNDLTLKTQLNTSIVGNTCYYSNTFQSVLLEYLNNPVNPNFQNQKQTLSNIVKGAYQVLIDQGYITDLQIYVLSVVLNYVTIKTVSVDAKDNDVQTSWTNA
jgi:glutamine phosphoribosylpyrophosphate amidotransferase